MGTVQKSTPVKDLRTQVKLTRVQVAAALGIKSEKTIFRWEVGESAPNLTPKQTALLIELYQCTLDDLVQAFDELEASKSSTESAMLEPSFS